MRRILLSLGLCVGLLVGCFKSDQRSPGGGRDTAGTGGADASILRPRMDGGVAGEPAQPTAGTRASEPAGAGAGGSGAVSPEPDRSWAPPMQVAGPDGGVRAEPVSDAGVGWRDSMEPFCDRQEGLLEGHSVWSDGESVYALVARAGSGVALWRHDQVRWKRILEGPELTGGRVRGFPGGPLIVHGEPSCGIRYVEDGAARCVAPIPAVGLHVAASDLAFAVRDDRVLVTRGGDWTQLGEPLEPVGSVAARAVWGDANRVLVGTSTGAFVAEDLDAPEYVAQDLPEDDYLAAWGDADGTLWLGNRSSEIWRYDGDWKLQWSRGERCRGGIRRFWGDGEALFFHTHNELFRLRDGRVDTLASFPCDGEVYINDLWGNSAEEVFVSIVDMAYDETLCGTTFLVWFDGKQLRQF